MSRPASLSRFNEPQDRIPETASVGHLARAGRLARASALLLMQISSYHVNNIRQELMPDTFP